jgi:integrase
LLATQQESLHAEHLTDKLARDFHRWLKAREGLSNTSVNSYFAQVKNLAGNAVQAGHFTHNPFSGVRKLKEYRTHEKPFNLEYARALATFIRGMNPAFWRVCAMQYYCFIRPAELIQLRIEQVDFKRRMIHVPATLSKASDGWVLIPPMLWDELTTWSWSNLQPELYLFGPDFLPSMKPVTRDHLSKTHLRIGRQFNLPPGTSLYSWKHTGVLALVEAGANMREVQAHCRHCGLHVTERYLGRLGVKQHSEAMRKFPRV